MARVACIMMQRNEGDLLRAWIEYYSHLFGRFNLFIFDNNSDDELTLKILSKYQIEGLSINRKFNRMEHHTQKDRIFGDLIRELDKSGNFDFTIPVDCDEFFVLRVASEMVVTADPGAIHDALHQLIAQPQALGIDTAYYNILGKQDEFFCWPQRKTFFRGGTFGWMDSGFHDGKSKLAEGKYETNFAHIHYHHKPYKILVEHSKNKLRPYFDPDDIVQIKDPKNKNRLTDFINDGEQAYLEKFRTNGTKITSIIDRFQAIGIRPPFI